MEENETNTQQEEKEVVEVNLTKKEKLVGAGLVLISITTIFLAVAFVVTANKGEVFTTICNAAWLIIAVQWWRTLHGLRIHVKTFIRVLEEMEIFKEKLSIQDKLIKNQDELIALHKEKAAINEAVKKNLAEQLRKIEKLEK